MDEYTAMGTDGKTTTNQRDAAFLSFIPTNGRRFALYSGLAVPSFF
jgi:hypothetical protein